MLNWERFEKKAKKAQAKYNLTDKEMQSLQQSAWAVYEQVSYDLTPDSKKNRTCKRSTIIEVVLDANRTEHYMEQTNRMTPVLKVMFQSHNYKDLQDLVSPAFTAKQYDAGPYPDEMLKGI